MHIPHDYTESICVLLKFTNAINHEFSNLIAHTESESERRSSGNQKAVTAKPITFNIKFNTKGPL